MDKPASNVTVLPSSRVEVTTIESRETPVNFEAEQALLGAIFINNNSFEQISDYLRAEHFAEPAHGRIYAAIQKFIDRGQLANPVTLKNYFQDDEDLSRVGGAKYLGQLATAVVGVINVADYGKLVHDLFLRRQLISVGEDVVNTAFQSDIDLPASNQIEAAEQKLFDLATHGEYERGFRPFADALSSAIHVAEAAYKRDGKMSGLATSLIDLDKQLGGLHNSDLLILAGRPSMGKTALATNIAFNIAKSFKPKEGNPKEAEEGGIVGFFSLEMSAEQLATRILAEESGISSERIRRGELSHDDFHKVVLASQSLANAPLYIDDTPALTPSALRTRARRLKRQKGLNLIVIDYLQLMHSSGGKSNENRVQEISEITRSLKGIAKELNIPVIALSQLSRAVEQRDDKRPQLADLRESGSIEQDADVVMFVFREEYYLTRSEPTRKGDETDEKFNARYDLWRMRSEAVRNLAEVFVAKQRHGPIGNVQLHFDGAVTKFSNFIRPEELPGNVG